MENKLSRRQKAKLKSEQKAQSPVVYEEKSNIFNMLSNNPNGAMDALDQLVASYASEHKLMDLATKNSVVATCIDIISTIVASTPMNLYKQQKDGTFIPFKGRRFSDHKLSNPNEDDTAFTFKYKLVSSFLATGHNYLVSLGKETFVIPSVYCNLNEDKQTYSINIGGKTFTVKKANTVHIYKPSLNYASAGKGQLKYQSVVFSCLKEILLNDEITKFATRHMKGGMMAKGVLTQDKDATSSLAQSQMAALAKQFTEATSGDKATNTVMLPKGIDYQPIQQTATDSSMMELRTDSRKDIVRAFKIPESIFNSEAGASFATANIQEVTFYKNVIKPICVMIEEFLNRSDLFTSETEYFKFEVAEMVSADEEKIKAETNLINAQIAQALAAVPLFSANDIRRAAGHDPIVDINEEQIIEANINPFEIALTEEPQEEEEPLDEDAIVDEKQLKKALVQMVKKSKRGCNHA